MRERGKSHDPVVLRELWSIADRWSRRPSRAKANGPIANSQSIDGTVSQSLNALALAELNGISRTTTCPENEAEPRRGSSMVDRQAERAESEATVFLPIVEAYDRWSGSYDSCDNPLVFGASRIVEQLAEHVTGLDIIEFGCGTGRNLARLKHKGAAKLVGCDVSPGMLEQARARDPALTLLRQDMTQMLPLADGSADLILFSLALEHVSDLRAPLREARRLLRPAGRIAVIEIHPVLSLANVSAHFRDGGTVVRMPTFPHRFCDYINATAKVGLTITACRELLPRDFQGPTPEKIFKRGPDFPLLVEFSLSPRPE